MPTWKPFFDEVARTLLTFESKQDELLLLLMEMQASGLKTVSLRDKGADGQEIELAEIDPFTFLATFNRTGGEMRLALCKYLQGAWHLSASAPNSVSDLWGLPTVDARQSWFFPYAGARQADDVPSLWKLARVAVESPHSLDNALLSRCLRIQSVGLAKLTSGLLWLNAGAFLSLDSRMRKYLQAQGIEWDDTALESGDAPAYRALLKRVNEKLGYNYAQISADAGRFADDGARPKRFWAGGHDFGAGGGTQKDRFIRENIWQMNFADDDERPKAVASRALFDQISIGDEFAIKGCGAMDLVVHYIGRVREAVPETSTLRLEPLPDRRLFKGKRPVGKGAGNFTQTLLEVTRPEDIELIFDINALPQVLGESAQALEADTQVLVEEEEVLEPLPPAPLNQIFYGPPGTGKTYTSIEEAVRLIRGEVPMKDGERDHAACKADFDRLRREGRIGFVTFHQSFSYEEFVEGIRPALDESSTAGARYVCRDGVLKEMALRALGAALRPVKRGRVTFEQVWEAFVGEVKANPDQLYPGLISGDYKITIKSSDDVHGENKSGSSKTSGTTSRQQLELVWQKLDRRCAGTHNVLHPILGDGAHTYLVGTIIEELRRLEKTLRPDSAQVSSAIEAAKSYLRGSEEYQLAPLNAAPRFVLIVDEINRGNISKILGELITLLEDDKRLGAENALTVTLPYSGEAFALPPNLFLLGTMNTADKSLALLDVALRRRFEFAEMPPRFEVCRGLAPEMQQVLAELNRRLTLSRDREHRIGHAYFVRVSTPEEFDHLFERKIIPLLQEFFFNDWDGLRAVLGESKLKQGRFIRALSGDDGSRARTRWQWWVDEARDKDAAPLSCFEVLKSNYGVASPSAASSELGVASGGNPPEALEGDGDEEAA